jgi:hypothetical protein
MVYGTSSLRPTEALWKANSALIPAREATVITIADGNASTAQFECHPEFNFARICARRRGSGEGSKDAPPDFRQ